jgi:diguanylate cyclase (GGDEF)-like protein
MPAPSIKATPEPDATTVAAIHVRETHPGLLAIEAAVVGREPDRDATVTRYDTPLLPPSRPETTGSRATLTVLTGLYAGLIVAIDADPVTIGRAADADLSVQEMGVSRVHARVARSPDGEFYVEDLGSRNGTFLRAGRVGVASLQSGDQLQLGPHLRVRFAVVDVEEEALYRRLYQSSILDALTHVFNRRYFGDRLVAETGHARRSGSDVTVLMIDVDGLKGVNDHFGHLSGDRALCMVAARIVRVLRVEDMLARYGGDEFVVLAAGTGNEEGLHLAERIRRAVEELSMSARGREVRLTASIGIASFTELASRDGPSAALIALADRRMYVAKNSGKNRVCSSG